MRNFSSQVPQSLCVSYFVHDKIGSNGFRAGVELLSRAFCNKAFRTFPDSFSVEYSGSEQAVIDDFSAWVTQLNEQTSRVSNGAFVYINLNEGYSLVFVGWAGYEDYTLNYSCEQALRNMLCADDSINLSE